MDKTAMIKMINLKSDFFHILEQIYQAVGAEELTRLYDKNFIIRPAAALNFPVRDVFRILEEPANVYLECQFLGLYGVDSPLPGYFNELCLKQDDTGCKLRDFLDVINHRSYVLYFLAWRAFQPERTVNSTGTYLAFINALSGYQPTTDVFTWPHFIAQTLDGLKAAIVHIIPDIPVCIHRYPEWTEMGEPPFLGKELSLGDSSFLGTRILLLGSFLDIELGPLPSDRVQSLQASLPTLQGLLRTNLDVHMHCKITLFLIPNRYSPGLGSKNLFLGRESWLGDGGDKPIQLRMNI
ncbi:type VI secretion system baseplate subunit TssG [Legionella londiniensis]|uniref:Type VI secretion protein n=1 Tax=Legionella londiniensis TaxID=45068 RepID=A0A0W0VMH7_9GAMM|nr:type VI secretion system baseplate subunit TssG [Legionella londiniensis]KTD21322.1 hypothetical protein Llon_1420 [Legionella londiniensis]STX93622.1 Uncharacterized protein conserved in bacteria [Legionella londiniensis]